jgi:PAS domain S-box-containing protein
VCREEILGIMTLDHTRGLRLFTSKEINVVIGVAQQAAIAIENFRLKSEAARARETLRVAGEILAAGLITLTGEHRILSLDPMAESLLQWRTSEVEGKGFSQAFSVTDREGVRLPDVAQAADLVLRSPRRDPPVLYFRKKDGSRVLCEVRTAPVRDDLGEVVEVVCALRRTDGDGEVEKPLESSVSRRVLNAAP